MLLDVQGLDVRYGRNHAVKAVNVTLNEGEMTFLADTQAIGDLTNNGTVTVQSGIFTITGSLSGSGNRSDY